MTVTLTPQSDVWLALSGFQGILLTEAGDYLTTEDGSYLYAEGAVPSDDWTVVT